MWWGIPAHKIIRGTTTMLLLVRLVLPECRASGQDADGRNTSRPLFGVAVRTSILEERFRRTRSEEEAVSKMLLNSNVTGTQCTVTETRLRVVPDPKSLRLEFLNCGDVTSQTTGFNRQATVDSVGKHHFEVIKPLWFDGSVFLTVPAYGTIRASQTPQRVVSTVGASMPLLGPLSDRVAWNEVARRTPQINQAVAEDVSRDVLPKIDRLIDADFARLQRQWTTTQQQVNSEFEANGLTWAARSDEESVAVWTEDRRSCEFDSVTAVPQEARIVRDDEAVVAFVSEDAVGTLLEKYFPAGLRLTDTQLQKIALPENETDWQGQFSLEQLVGLISQIRSMEGAEAGLFTLEFAPQHPLEIHFAGGDVRLTATFQIHPKIGASSGWMSTTFNLHGKRLSANEWTVAVRSVDVGENAELPQSIASEGARPSLQPLRIPTEGDTNEGNDFRQNPDVNNKDVTTVQAGTVWIPIIRNAAETLAEKIPHVKLPLEFDGPEAIAGSLRFRLGRIDSANGILRVSLRIRDAESVTSDFQNR